VVPKVCPTLWKKEKKTEAQTACERIGTDNPVPNGADQRYTKRIKPEVVFNGII